MDNRKFLLNGGDSKMSKQAYLNPRNTEMLILQTMEALCGSDAFISLEGFHVPEEVCALTGASPLETELLRRNTTAPVLQFVVVPLSLANLPTLMASLGHGSVLEDECGLIHIQIAKGGQLAFGAYDNVHEECTVLYPPFTQSLGEALVKSGAITSFVINRT